VRQPKPIRALRPEVPQELADIVDKMMAKDAADRYQTPQEVAEALNPWTQTAIPPPPEAEMPSLDFGPRSSGTGSNNTPISRSVLSPLGIRSSPPTPISRAPKIVAPRTVLRAPGLSGPQPAALAPADVTAQKAAAPATPRPAVSAEPEPAPCAVACEPIGEKKSAPSPPAEPRGDESSTDHALAAPAPAGSAAEAPAADPANAPAVESDPAPETRPNLASKAPTKLSAPRAPVQPRRRPTTQPAKKPVASSQPAPAPKAALAARKPSPVRERILANGNVWIVAGAAILTAGVSVLIWALL